MDGLSVLTREFPELGEAVVERELANHNNDVPSARAALLAISRGAAGQGEAEAEDGEGQSWLSWLGFSSSSQEQAGPSLVDDIQNGLATVALGLQQAANALGSIIPPELNPFVEVEYVEYEEPEEADKERDLKGAGTQLISPNLTKRNQKGPGPSGVQQEVSSPRGLSDEEDDVAKKWD